MIYDLRLAIYDSDNNARQPCNHKLSIANHKFIEDAAQISDVAGARRAAADRGSVHVCAAAGHRAQGNPHAAHQRPGASRHGAGSHRAFNPVRRRLCAADGAAHGDAARLWPFQRGPGTHRRARQRRQPAVAHHAGAAVEPVLLRRQRVVQHGPRPALASDSTRF